MPKLKPTEITLARNIEETDAAYAARMAAYKKAVAANTGEEKDLIEIKVRRGRVVNHNGERFKPGDVLYVTPEQRDRLATLGSIEGGVELPRGIGPAYDQDDQKRMAVG